MDKKTLILVIILCVLIGIGIFYADNFIDKKPKSFANQITSTVGLTNPTPIPTPTPPAIDANSNLKQEIDKLITPDFSSDYSNFKKQVNQTF